MYIHTYIYAYMYIYILYLLPLFISIYIYLYIQSLGAFRRAESRGWSLGCVDGALGAAGSQREIQDLLGVPWGSLGVIGGSLGVAGGGPRRPQGLLGEGPGGNENTEGVFKVSWESPGAPLE